MIKAINLVLAAIAALLFTALVMAQNQASDAQDRLANLRAELTQERGRIVSLEANVAHLEDPEQLRELARLHLGFEPIRPSQEIAVDELPRLEVTLLASGSDTSNNSVSNVHRTSGNQSGSQTGSQP